MLLNVMENNSEMIYDTLPVKHDGCSIRYGKKKPECTYTLLNDSKSM